MIKRRRIQEENKNYIQKRIERKNKVMAISNYYKVIINYKVIAIFLKLEKE